jgi:chromosome segregation ATPase
MKSRIRPPIESTDAPYTCAKGKSEHDGRELKLPHYKTSLTPPSWPTELASEVERKLAQAEEVLEDVARREQVLAAQVNAHRHWIAELAEERALFDGERKNHAKQVKQAEEALNRMREELALKSQTLELRRQADVDHRPASAPSAAPIETEGSWTPQEAQGADGSERVVGPVPDAVPLLSRLAKQAADFASLAHTVTELQRHLAGERTGHDAMARSQMDELRKREEALVQRESETDKRINELTADRESLARAQEEFAIANRENAERQLKFQATETDLAARENALALRTGKLREEEARLTSKQNAIAALVDGHHQRENELLRREQDVRERAAELGRRQAELATTETEVRAAGREAVAMQEALERVNGELAAGLAKLRNAVAE